MAASTALQLVLYKKQPLDAVLDAPDSPLNALDSRDRGLSRAILDQGWSLFKEQLAYKLEWRGGELVLVHPAYTSQRCHACAHTHADNRKGEVFRCRSCGHTLRRTG